MHEVHGPDLVDGLRHAQGLWLVAHQPFARFDAQVQLQFPVDPVDALVVPSKASDVAQVQVAQPKAPVAVVVRQADQPIGDLLVFGVALGFVAVAGLADGEDVAGQPYADATLSHYFFGHLAAARRPRYFFARYSVAKPQPTMLKVIS